MSGQTPIAEADPEMYALLQEEKHRQTHGIELIASENFASRAVCDALGSCPTNKYAEGLPGKRYYGGTAVVDKIEQLCIDRALAAFHLDPAEWGVNVQSYSGSTANFNAYTGLLKPHQRLMGLDLPSGGHLTHGYQTDKRKISATSIYFESMPYRLHPDTGIIDYDRLEENAHLFRPNLIVCGASAYPRDFDYARLRTIADQHGAWLMMDMAHIGGLVAAQVVKNPFEYADVVTTTTHKTLRGPRAGLIFYRKGSRTYKASNGRPVTVTYDFDNTINFAVFPGCQGGPHMNAIAAVAVALYEAQQPSFREYQEKVCANAKRLGEALKSRGYSLVTNGTDNHLVLWDVRPQGLTGSKLEYLFERCAISVNKNAVYGDVSALSPGGVRLGSPAMTSRGLTEGDFDTVAEFLHRGVCLAQAIMEKHGKRLSEFQPAVEKDDGVAQLKVDVEAWASKFPMPGSDLM